MRCGRQGVIEWKYLIQREPEIAGLNVLLADTYLEAGRYEEAIAACEEALRIAPDRAKAHYNLGRAYLQMGNRDLAMREYGVLQKLDTESAEKLHDVLNGQGRSMETDHGTSRNTTGGCSVLR